MFYITPGTTNVTIYVRLRDSTTGLAKTGLAYNSAGASAYYTRPRAAAAAITLATQTVTGAHSDGGFVEVDATNAKGLYRLDLPDAVCAASPDLPYVVVSVEFDDTIEEAIAVHLGAQVETTDVGTAALALINAEVVDTLVTDTYAEIASVPAATSSLKDKINWLFLLARNKINSTSTTIVVRNDADGANVASSTQSDNGTTYTRGEWT